ncbi:PaaI family thioesterase [Nocardia sp. NPDC059246]|uniref:PaaI family thioesterase n=1 Tax=unclassified Nocardia TaxID=2637762 RepID=UPI0036A245DD
MTQTEEAAHTRMVRWFPPVDRAPSAWVEWANQLPLVSGLGVVATAVTDDSVTFEVPAAPLCPNPNGSVNGGLVIAIADQVMGVVAARVAAPGQLAATGTLSTQFISPALPPLELRGAPTGGGRRVTFVEVVVYDKDGNRCAVCQGAMIAGAAARQEPTG